MEYVKTLSAIFFIIAVFMVNSLCGVWITRSRRKLVSKQANPLP